MGGPEDTKLAYYRLDTKAVLKELASSKDGLSSSEATTRLTQVGPNALQQVHKETWLHRYLKQFKDLMIILLLASSVIAFILDDQRAGIVLLALVLFNTLIGFLQEFKAEKLMESLEKLVVAEAQVLRDGQLQVVAATELVPGDVVYIEEGNAVPADLRLIKESELATNDFALTGESEPSRKFTHAIESDVELANRHNLVFMSTSVATGHAYGVVIGTGMQTELGRIASLSAAAPNNLSPLQRELNHIAGRVTQGTVILCAILLPIAIKADLGIKGAFLFAIGIASSIIPQGLPAEINSSLAQAANRLAKARALVKKLSAVESLGATSIILTDKTGTLTKNEMTVEAFLVGQKRYRVTGSGYEQNGTIVDERGKLLEPLARKELELFLAAGVFASNARISPPDEDHATWYCVGDPTEGALITLAEKGGLDATKLDTDSPELKEFAFDSARKRMSSIRRFGPHGQLYVFVKGAPENVIDRCREIWDHGHIRKLTVKDIAAFRKQHDQWAEHAMRNLAYAYKILPADTNLKQLKMEDVEQDLTLLGMVSMIDPLREEVPAAMQAAHAAHIKVSIITGDFATTARAIAHKAGLTEQREHIIVVSGEELRKLDDAQVLQLVIRGGVIFSRVSPEDKLHST
jgi:Ca2+-transporting ATPase